MPIPTPSSSRTEDRPEIFPRLTVDQVDAALTSRWYSKFEDLTIRSTIINLESIGEKEVFLKWLDSESIFIPTDAEADTESSKGENNAVEKENTWRLPDLSRRIRETIKEFGGGVFPKLNWTAPRDAAFLLPQTNGPLHSSSPADIFLLLKSSDFVSHSLDPTRVYEGCTDLETVTDSGKGHEVGVELVLKKWENMNPSREFRCFVRNDILIGVSVRDFNFYPHFQDPSVLQKVCETIRSFYQDEIWGDYEGGQDYVFDVILDDLHSSARLIDFNPYTPSTDSLLFTYPELHEILLEALEPIPTGITESDTSKLSAHTGVPRAEAGDDQPVGTESGTGSETGSEIQTGARSGKDRRRLPIIKVIDSQSHPEANRGMPAFGTNMMPVEMVEMSQGMGVGEFRAAWDEVVRDGILDQGDSESDSDSDEER